ncbi:uncharacterized protein LOC117152198 [Bombus impatiens]|uniref:Uncharacterized protein LOC117152198 n=1 Tax=Bombus impatiens TaxID=132113 RepID=A0A6P8L4X0_BOMIM|nr:uncharacterized protein LOC117152198 [Bombus impatiens]
MILVLLIGETARGSGNRDRYTDKKLLLGCLEPEYLKRLEHVDLDSSVELVTVEDVSLSANTLLERCLGSETQNNNDSLNSLLWTFAPKHIHAGTRIIEIATFLAVSILNEGFITHLKNIGRYGNYDWSRSHAFVTSIHIKGRMCAGLHRVPSISPGTHHKLKLLVYYFCVICLWMVLETTLRLLYVLTNYGESRYEHLSDQCKPVLENKDSSCVTTQLLYFINLPLNLRDTFAVKRDETWIERSEIRVSDGSKEAARTARLHERTSENEHFEVEEGPLYGAEIAD